MLPPGLCAQVLTHKSSLRCRDGGFLTWAAKPSVRESPDPANDVALFLASHLYWPFYPLQILRSRRAESSLAAICANTSLDAACIFPVARKSHQSILLKGTTGKCFVSIATEHPCLDCVKALNAGAAKGTISRCRKMLSAFFGNRSRAVAVSSGVITCCVFGARPSRAARARQI
jgi:hypothetical protein